MLSENQTKHNTTSSFSSLIEENHLPALNTLIDNEVYEALLNLGRYFPPSISPFWVYEIPLYSDKSRIDFLFCTHKPETFLQCFRQPTREAERTFFFHDAIYERFTKFAALWADRTPSFGELISNIWFEYDYNDLMKPIPRPNFFYAPKGSFNQLEIVWATHQIMELLSGKKESKETYRLLLHCMTNLKEGGWISQIGRMFARQDNTLRLFIQDIPDKGILPYLERIDYKHTANKELISLLSQCYHYSRQVGLDIDILDKVEDKIGLECYFPTVKQAQAFLKELKNRGICRNEKYLRLNAYLKEIQFDTGKPFQHFLSHFKIIFQPTEGFIAKAYVGYVKNDLAKNIIRTQPLTLTL